ncbi:MAG: cupin domain-containing protein [Clostridium sp.]|jgi:mannose-6-phosphate isomerase-like protein (cupin superfamily)|uniref:cupin domain-containing protein n=1 Tax=Clostridium sp. TaxID=1506 RepID=UPI0025BF3369|nr:cupin domain-containing protein [Clostridium sp.]MCH3965267.1 cupin domain-containing protein [Clostridium sp.]MCI1714487.1 cupin domain-containing protein [Clostridium sp.]MCI1798749.1 cupin domain-containing protein [Clostridium sp.]MCI1812520.1 cupin domain-containing protein [Clostridium sp.]MCI1869559.1 cupin domain-containing protein [Clostridium sp.]
MYRKYPCYYYYNVYPYPCVSNGPIYDPNYLKWVNNQYRSSNDEVDYNSGFSSSQSSNNNDQIQLRDYGPQPFVVDINKATKQNNTFRTALWTGNHLQVTLMSINVGDDIGLEVHPNVDQFIRVEEGQGLVRMGNSSNNLYFQKRVEDDFAIMIPAGTWHDVINTGNKPLKVYSIYAPPQHPRNTVHVTKADAEAAEKSQK